MRDYKECPYCRRLCATHRARCPWCNRKLGRDYVLVYTVLAVVALVAFAGALFVKLLP